MFCFSRYKDGAPVRSSSHLQVKSVGHRHQLRVSNVSKIDEGQYVCTANSTGGTKSCAAKLSIQGTIYF